MFRGDSVAESKLDTILKFCRALSFVCGVYDNQTDGIYSRSLLHTSHIGWSNEIQSEIPTVSPM